MKRVISPWKFRLYGHTRQLETRRNNGPRKQVGYLRVSTLDQNTARQLQGITLDKVFEDKCSGKDIQRPQLQACLEYLREDDTLHVHSLDRLARNVEDLLAIVRSLTEQGVTVIFHKEGLTFAPESADNASGMSRLMLTIMGAIAEFERNLIRERQREGIALAKAAGKYRGRQCEITEAIRAEICQRKEAGVPVAKIARQLGRSRQWVYKALQA